MRHTSVSSDVKAGINWNCTKICHSKSSVAAGSLRQNTSILLFRGDRLCAPFSCLTGLQQIHLAPRYNANSAQLTKNVTAVDSVLGPPGISSGDKGAIHGAFPSLCIITLHNEARAVKTVPTWWGGQRGWGCFICPWFNTSYTTIVRLTVVD
jgi:hypothetical protein